MFMGLGFKSWLLEDRVHCVLRLTQQTRSCEISSLTELRALSSDRFDLLLLSFYPPLSI